MSDLRQQAVEAAAAVVGRDAAKGAVEAAEPFIRAQVIEEVIEACPMCGGGAREVAAEPFIRALVVQEVVNWLRANADADDLGGMLRGTANSILREFGGTDA